MEEHAFKMAGKHLIHLIIQLQLHCICIAELRHMDRNHRVYPVKSQSATVTSYHRLQAIDKSSEDTNLECFTGVTGCVSLTSQTSACHVTFTQKSHDKEGLEVILAHYDIICPFVMSQMPLAMQMGLLWSLNDFVTV